MEPSACLTVLVTGIRPIEQAGSEETHRAPRLPHARGHWPSLLSDRRHFLSGKWGALTCQVVLEAPVSVCAALGPKLALRILSKHYFLSLLFFFPTES